MTDSNSYKQLIWDFRCASQSILFSYVPFCKQGGSNFEEANFVQQNFKVKIKFFCAVSKYGMLLLICQSFKKMIRTKYKSSVISHFLRCFKKKGVIHFLLHLCDCVFNLCTCLLFHEISSLTSIMHF